MGIAFPCPHCHKILHTKREFAGRQAKCPGCHAVLAIPALGDLHAHASAGQSTADETLERMPPQVGRSHPAPLSPASAAAQPSATPDLPPKPILSLFEVGDMTEPIMPPLPSVDSAEANDCYEMETSSPDGTLYTLPNGHFQVETETDPVDATVVMPPSFNVVSAVPPRKDYLAWASAAFLLSMVPLIVLFSRTEISLAERVAKTAQSLNAASDEESPASNAEPQPEGTTSLVETAPMLDPRDVEEMLHHFPDHRIMGALLSQDTWMHWLFALVAAVGFLGILFVMSVNSSVDYWRLLLSGIATGTAGIILLYTVQVLAQFSVFFRTGLRISYFAIIICVLRAIEFSYECALATDSPFWAQFAGYTFGVGLCEELCKALPIILFFRDEQRVSWRSALMVGLASGIGFGISEGITFSTSHYNGIADGLTYLVRFTSCVSLHAIWCATVALLLYPHRERVLNVVSYFDYPYFIVRFLLVSMVLHGLYDALLSRNLHLWAIAVALSSYGLLLSLIFHSRSDARQSVRARRNRLLVG